MSRTSETILMAMAEIDLQFGKIKR